jgi:hypothetical protein
MSPPFDLPSYRSLCVRLIALLSNPPPCPPDLWDLEREEQRIASAVCKATGLSPEHWAGLDQPSREPWLEQTISTLESEAMPDAIARIADAALRERALEVWEASRYLSQAINLWEIWLLRATPQEVVHTGNALYQQSMARQAVEVLLAHAADIPSLRGRSVEEVLSRFPEVPFGPISQEKDAEFIRCVREAMPGLLDLYRELERFVDRAAAAPLSAITAAPAGGGWPPVEAAEDDSAYRPAKEFLDAPRFPTIKRLRAALKRQPWIRTRKPSPQRLKIHAGDWHQYKAMLDAAGFDALDVAGETADAFMAEARRRQEEIRRRKAKG